MKVEQTAVYTSTTAENITFMIIRGLVALAIVGLAFYCIGKGIYFFLLPQTVAQTIQIHLLGLTISADGIGAVIFGTGVALAYVGKLTAPKRIETRRNDEQIPVQPAVRPETRTDTANKAQQVLPEAVDESKSKPIPASEPAPAPMVSRSQTTVVVESVPREEADFPSKSGSGDRWT